MVSGEFSLIEEIIFMSFLKLLLKRCPRSDFRGRTYWSKSGTPTSCGNTMAYSTKLENTERQDPVVKVLCKVYGMGQI